MFRKTLPAMLAALLASSAFAQDAPAPSALDAPTTPNGGMTESQLHRPTTLSEGYRALSSDNLASLVIGMSVFSGTADTADLIGSIDDLVVSADGKIAAVILGVGSYLGTEEKSVAIDFAQLQWSKAPDGSDRIVLNTTKDALAAAPNFAWRSDISTAKADVAKEDAEAAAIAPNANNASNVSPDATTDQPQPGHVDSAGLQPIDAAALTAEDLKGIAVYGTDDELIGTIGDFVLDANGKVDAVVVDVGGFLGLGKKPVAVGFDNLAFSVDANNNRYLFLNASKQVLEDQPPFDKATYASDRAAQRLVVHP